MLAHIRNLWNTVQGSLWFLPSILVLVYIGLAFFMVWLDKTAGNDATTTVPLVFNVGPDGAREMLSVIASSMLTVASVAFSFTVVVFSFASAQYSSRTLHNFMDDNVSQGVLGALLGSFVYCLLVLRTIQSGNNSFVETPFVPALSVTVALLLAVIDLGLFILFIHHIAETIQAYHIIHRVGVSTIKALDHLFDSRQSQPTPKVEKEDLATILGPTVEVCSHHDGYIQAVDSDTLVKLTGHSDLVVQFRKAVGNYVVNGETLADVGPAERVTDKVVDEIRDSFLLSAHRTLYQDPQYGILQLSDIAMKALSPGINDPNTAIMSLNQMSSVLRHVASRELPSEVHYGAQDKIRAIVHEPTFESMAAQAFDQVRRYGTKDAAIPIKMLSVIEEIAAGDILPEHLDVLRAHVSAIVEDADRELKSSRDRRLLNDKIAAMPQSLLRETHTSLLRVV